MDFEHLYRKPVSWMALHFSQALLTSSSTNPPVSTNRRAEVIFYYPHLQSVAENLGRFQNLWWSQLLFTQLWSSIPETFKATPSWLLNHKTKQIPCFSSLFLPTSSQLFLLLSPPRLSLFYSTIFAFFLFLFFSSPSIQLLLEGSYDHRYLTNRLILHYFSISRIERDY